MRAGLEASTVTPGKRAPVASFTLPTMEPWAIARAGSNTHARTTITNLVVRPMFSLSPLTLSPAFDATIPTATCRTDVRRSREERTGPRHASMGTGRFVPLDGEGR